MSTFTETKLLVFTIDSSYLISATNSLLIYKHTRKSLKMARAIHKHSTHSGSISFPRVLKLHKRTKQFWFFNFPSYFLRFSNLIARDNNHNVMASQKRMQWRGNFLNRIHVVSTEGESERIRHWIFFCSIFFLLLRRKKESRKMRGKKYWVCFPLRNWR